MKASPEYLSFIMDKLSPIGGQEAHKKLLEQEGYKVVQKGKKYLVQDFQKYLISLWDII